MKFADTPIQKKLAIIVMLTTAAALLVTCAAFFAYELTTYRETAIRHLETLGQVTADNSTAALAFQNRDDAAEVLSALKAHPDIRLAALFDQEGKMFARYPREATVDEPPPGFSHSGFGLVDGHLIGLVQVTQGRDRRLGTLFLKAGTGEINKRLRLYATITLVVFAASLAVAYVTSSVLQRQISYPLLSLATTARAISEQRDYAVRMPAGGKDELGVLNRAFNHMLKEIEKHVAEAEQAARTIRGKNRELESLMYVVSHDLREPLRTIQNFSEMLGDDYADKLDEDGQHLLTRIRIASDRLERLLLDLLDVSRASRTTKPTVSVNARKLVDGALERLAERIRDSRAKVRIDDHLPDLFVDETWAGEAVLNLLSNAMKYTRPGADPEVEVSGFAGEDGVGIAVADRGPGVPEGQEERIFQLFQRAVSRDIEGTGAGLAIVREVAEKHGGRVWVENRDGGGARFVITFGRQQPKPEASHE